MFQQQIVKNSDYSLFFPKFEGFKRDIVTNATLDPDLENPVISSNLTRSSRYLIEEIATGCAANRSRYLFSHTHIL